MAHWSMLRRIIPLLKDSAYATTALTLPSVGAEPPITSTDEDTALVYSTVSELAEQVETSW